MKRSQFLILCMLILTLFVAFLTSGCAEVKVLPPLNKKVNAEECATLIIPADAKVNIINGLKRGWFKQWWVGFSSSGLTGSKVATLLVPAGENSITFEYSHPLDGWAVRKLEYKKEMNAGKMYILSVKLGTKEEINKIFSAFNIASSFLRDNIIEIIPFIDYLPRPNPDGVIYKINEIDKAAFDQYLIEEGNYRKKSKVIVLLGFLIGVLWALIGLVGLRAMWYVIFMGKFQNRHPVIAFFISAVLVVSGVIIINYNSSGIFSYYIISTFLIGFGISNWDFGGRFFKSGYEKIGEKNYAGAISDFNDAVKMAPFNAVYINERGMAYYNLKEFEKAVTDFTNAVKMQPNNAKFINNRGMAYCNLQDWKRAIADFINAVKFKPTNAEYINNRGMAYYYFQDFEKAVVDLTNAIQLKPNNAEYINNRGLVYYNLQDWGKAIADFANAVKLNPKNDIYKTNLTNAQAQIPKGKIGTSPSGTMGVFANAEAAFNSGIEHYKNGDYSKALIDFTEAIKLNPKSAWAFAYRGATNRCLKEIDNAIMDLNEAIRLDSNFAWAYAERGLTYLKKGPFRGTYDKALSDFSEAIRLDANDYFSYSCRGDIYRCKEEYDKAIMDYTEALKLNPDDESAKKYLEMVKKFKQEQENQKTDTLLSPDIIKKVAILDSEAEFKNFMIDYPQKLASEGYYQFEQNMMGDKTSELFSEVNKLPYTMSVGEIYEYTHDPYKLLISRGELGVLWTFIKKEATQ